MTLRSSLLLTVAAASIVAAFLVLPETRAAAAPPPPRPLPVPVVEVLAADSFDEAVTATGRAVARRETRLGFERGGRVEAVRVEEGDRVRAGQELALLDSARLLLQAKELEAQLAAAEAVLAELEAGPRAQTVAAARAEAAALQAQAKLAELEAGRRHQLHQEGVVAEEERDRARYRAGAADSTWRAAEQALAELEAGTRPERLTAQRARVDGLAARLELLRLELERCVLRAPYDAVVLDRSLDEGAVTEAGAPLLRLREAGVLEARIGVAPELADSLRPGDRYPLSGDSSEHSATLRAVLPEVDPRTRTRTAVFELEETAALSPGSSLSLSLPIRRQGSGYWLPASALSRGERGMWSVSVIERHGDQARVRRAEVQLLHSESERVLARGPLLAGMQVISSGADRVVPGQLVSPTP